MPDLSTKPLAELTVDGGVRPKAPPVPAVTDDQRRQGRRLAAIHRMHLNDIGRIRGLLDQIERGELNATDGAKRIQEIRGTG